MKTFYRNLIILMIAALILAACGSSASRSEDIYSAPAGGDSADYQKNLEVPMAEPAMAANPAAENNGVDVSAYSQDRIVIQNADLTVVVKDPRVKMTEISALAVRLGGFVVSSNMSQTSIGDNDRVPQGNITIRVPAKDLDLALNEIKAGTVDVQNENRSGQDVTEQYVDLQSQLKAKQAAADKLFEILEKTTKAEDTLMVFNQLTQVQSEIEVLKGQINYYEQAATFSAVSVRMIAEETIKPIEIAGWRPQGVARDALQSLIEFLQNFVEFLIWLVILILPVAAILIAVMAVLWRLLRWFWRKVFPRKSSPAVTVASPPAKIE